MIFRQFIDEDLGCASYLIGDGGEAAVIDPSWETTPYLEFAAAHRLRISRVFETHTHADHLSGRGRIVAATGAEILLPSGAVAAFPHRPLREGDVVAVGNVRIEALATPGHRPEHISLVVTNRSLSDEPIAVLSGDSLLVGDVARPDLATRNEAEIEDAARSLFASVRRFADLPDHVEVWPGHIGGSLCCGSGVSEKPSSTIGYERRANLGLATSDRERFVDDVLTRIPERRPPTADVVVRLNRGPLLGKPAALEALGVDDVQRLLDQGGAIIDGRPVAAFDDASIPGSLCLPLGLSGIGTKAAWLLDRDQPLVVLAATDEQAEQLASRLGAVGLLDVRGRLTGGVEAWKARGRPLARIGRVDAEEATDLVSGGAVLLDVRDSDEHLASPVAGSLQIPWRDLRLRAAEARSSRKGIVVACATGSRTPIAASILTEIGGPPVFRLAEGGIADVGNRLSRRYASDRRQPAAA
jgi:hydroxyacylglutathione hydrolase